MELNDLWQQTGVAMLGGTAAEILHWYMLSRKPEGIDTYKASFTYWLTTGLMILVGGAMPFLYLTGTASSLLCFHLGAATPILLQKLVAAPPPITVSQGALPSHKSVRDFLSW